MVPVRSTLVAFLLLLLPSVAVADTVPGFANWPRMNFDGWRCSVRLPANARRVNRVRETWVGEVDELMLDASVDEGHVAMQVRELPPGTRWLVTRNYILQRVEQGILADGNRRKLSSRDVTRNGHRGRRIRYEDLAKEDWIEEAVFILVENRLYFLFASHEDRDRPGVPIDDFFESLDLH